jgi:hypothetical protein
MATMNLDRWLAALGLALAVFGLLLAYYFYIKTIRTKVLGIAYTNPVPLMLPLKEINVSYLGATQTALSRVFVLLWNKGTSPIETSDFIAPITVRGQEQILLLKTYDKDAAATVVISPEDKTVTVNLLRPGEAIILQIDAAHGSYRPDLSIQMKSSDMSVLLRQNRGVLLAIPSILMSALTLLLGMYTFQNVPLPQWMTAGDFLAISGQFAVLGFLFLLSFIVAGATFFIAQKLLFGSTSPSIALRFFDLQFRIYSVVNTWKSLRKQIEVIIDKK